MLGNSVQLTRITRPSVSLKNVIPLADMFCPLWKTYS